MVEFHVPSLSRSVLSVLPQLDYATMFSLGAIRWEPRPLLAAAAKDVLGKWGAFDKTTAAALQVPFRVSF